MTTCRSAIKTRPLLKPWLDRISECLSDASVIEASPRMRFGAAQDAAVFAAKILAIMNGHQLDQRDPIVALTYLRSCWAPRSGLTAHVRRLAQFDREDYDRCWSNVDAVRALKASCRVTTALRWLVLANEPVPERPGCRSKDCA